MKNKFSLPPQDIARVLVSPSSGQYDRYLNPHKHVTTKEMIIIYQKYVVYEVLDE